MKNDRWLKEFLVKNDSCKKWVANGRMNPKLNGNDSFSKIVITTYQRKFSMYFVCCFFLLTLICVLQAHNFILFYSFSTVSAVKS